MIHKPHIEKHAAKYMRAGLTTNRRLIRAADHSFVVIFLYNLRQ